MSDHAYRAITMAVTQIFLGAYMMLLVNFRQPVKVWRLRWLAMGGGLVAANMAIILLGYFSFYSRLGELTLLVPYTLITVWCSRYRGARTVFNVANVFYVGCVCGANGYMAQVLFPTVRFLPLLVRILSLIFLFFVLRRFNKTSRKMMEQLESGWGFLCLIPITTCLLTLYTYRVYFQRDPLPAAVVLYGLLVICCCAFYLMYLFFERVQQENETRNNHRLLELQVSALRSRMEAVKTAEDMLRTERHDLRHRLQTAGELMARGDRQSAIVFLSDTAERLENYKTVHWCRPPVLDAMFAFYFSQAKRQDIPVDVNISLPDKLPVDEGELAIVFANALENAIHANLELPLEQRKIRCRVIGSPNLMLEISNPFLTAVQFDENGFPLAGKDGHGLGTQSIRFFCEKYGAVCQYEIADGLLSFRVIL